MSTPIICFGQQPNGILPKRYLIAKINTARRLQGEIGGKIVFFYHDSDADYKETITTFIDPDTKNEARLNFTQKNRIQKKFSPLYAKEIPDSWQEETARKLPRFVKKEIVDIFSNIKEKNAADFCLEMYKKMGLLDGIEIMRSSDRKFREEATDLQEFYCDVKYEGEIVRAKKEADKLTLHEGGGKYIDLPLPEKIEKWQKNPARDERFEWMQSVIHATHYVTGASEGIYLKKEDFPNVEFVPREEISDSSLAYVPE